MTWIEKRLAEREALRKPTISKAESDKNALWKILRENMLDAIEVYRRSEPYSAFELDGNTWARYQSDHK